MLQSFFSSFSCNLHLERHTRISFYMFWFPLFYLCFSFLSITCFIFLLLFLLVHIFPYSFISFPWSIVCAFFPIVRRWFFSGRAQNVNSFLPFPPSPMCYNFPSPLLPISLFHFLFVFCFNFFLSCVIGAVVEVQTLLYVYGFSIFALCK